MAPFFKLDVRFVLSVKMTIPARFSFRMNVTEIYNGATSTVANIVGLEPTVSRLSGDGDGVTDSDLDVSPVTLSSAWSRVARLLLLVSLAVCGSVGNVFMISAVMVEDQLNKRGTCAILSFTTTNKKRGRESARENAERFARTGRRGSGAVFQDLARASL